MAGGGGGGETTATMQLAPQQSAVLQAIMPTLQQFATTPASRAQSAEQVQAQIGALERALLEQGGESGSSDFRTSTNNQIAALRQQLAMQQAGIDPGAAPAPYEGQRIAGFTPGQVRGRQMLARTAQGALRDSSQGALGALDFLNSGAVLNPNRNPGLQGAINAAIRPLNRQFNRQVLPGIRDEAVLSGAYGGSRQGIAEGMAAQGLQSASADAAANIINPAYQAGLDAYTRGLALAPQTMQAALLPGQTMEALGAQGQALNQQRLNSDIASYYEQAYQPLNLAREVASIAFGMPIGGTTTQTQGASLSPGQGALGGAATGAALGSFFPGYGTAIGAGLGGLGGLLGLLG